MAKKNPVIILTIIAAVSVGVIIVFSVTTSPYYDDNAGEQHDYVWSGPLGVTKYQHRLGDDVFLVMRNLQPNDKDTIHIYTPKGVEFKTFSYSGAIKSNFNQYFYPDTFAPSNICTPEDLIGIWRIVFEDGSHPTLEFEMTDEWIGGAEVSITVVC